MEKNFFLPTPPAIAEKIVGAIHPNMRIPQKWVAAAVTEGTDENQKLRMAAVTVQRLLSAIQQGRSVFLKCEKWPRNLDSGKHHFSIYFVNDKGRIEKVWPGCCAEIARIFYMTDNRDQGMLKWTFSSGGWGMDRAFGATRGFCRLLEEITGEKDIISFEMRDVL